MSMIPEVKCRRCGETFSSMRSRCPNCGTRRVTQSGRTPGTTPGTVRGTASYERAETNTKWQMIFGLILVVAVILAVIVMVSTSLEGTEKRGNATITPPPAATDYIPIIDTPPTPAPTPTPTVESIRVMFYEKELEEFTMREGDANIPLTAQVLPATVVGAKVNWSVSDESGEYCTVTSTGDNACEVAILKAKPGGVTLTAECNGCTKNVQVYLLEAAK